MHPKSIHHATLLMRTLAVCLFAVTVPVQARADTSIIAAWVQLTPDGAEARAVVSGQCPDIQLDHTSVPMSQRAAPTSAHPDTVCYARLKPGLRKISVNGIKLPVPVSHPRHIAIVGDTGCRLSDKHGLYQGCNNDTVWPFGPVATRVAEYQPDLVIYTGDYIYRESPCPAGNKGCEGSPYGDNQATWLVEWLLPAQPIHAAAPLLLIRGNHETCSRAGDGWFRYLDARPMPPACEDLTDPWITDIGGTKIGIIDTANLKDSNGNDLTDYFAAQFRYLQRKLAGISWLATHQPIWGVGADDDTGELVTPSKVLQDAVHLAGLPTYTRMLISAHIHLAELLQFRGRRPLTLISANGGTQLVNRVSPPDSVDGEKIGLIKMFYQFGFITLDGVHRNEWEILFRDIDGKTIDRCVLKDKDLDCP